MMNDQHAMSGNGNGNGHALNGNGNGHSNRALDNYFAKELELYWKGNVRWQGITRPYTAKDVLRLRGSIQIEYTPARMGADRLWNLLNSEPYVAALGALTGNQ